MGAGGMIVRYARDGVRHGELRDGYIHPLTGDFPDFTSSDEAPIDAATVRLLAPVTPGKIVAVGPNYHAHLNGNPPPVHSWI